MAKERIDRDEEDLVRLYLTDIGQYPLLTKDDEVRLAQQIERGVEARAAIEENKKGLTPAKKRELRRAARDGDRPSAPLCSRTFVLLFPLRRNTRPQVCRCWTSSKKATLV